MVIWVEYCCSSSRCSAWMQAYRCGSSALELIFAIITTTSYRDIDIQFRRNKPQNVLEIAQIITMLSGELSRETRLQMLPTIDNVQDELQKLEDEKQQEVNSFGQYNALAQALAQAKAQPEGAEASPEDEPEEKAGEGA